MPISAISQQREAYCRYKSLNQFPAGNAEIISYKSEWAFRYQFFAAGAPLNWISHIFWLKPLKPFFVI
jgi:hypothetical protein